MPSPRPLLPTDREAGWFRRVDLMGCLGARLFGKNGTVGEPGEQSASISRLSSVPWKQGWSAESGPGDPAAPGRNLLEVQEAARPASARPRGAPPCEEHLGLDAPLPPCPHTRPGAALGPVSARHWPGGAASGGWVQGACAGQHIGPREPASMVGGMLAAPLCTPFLVGPLRWPSGQAGKDYSISGATEATPESGPGSLTPSAALPSGPVYLRPSWFQGFKGKLGPRKTGGREIAGPSQGTVCFRPRRPHGPPCPWAHAAASWHRKPRSLGTG